MTEQTNESTPTKRRRWPRWVKIVSGCFLAGLLIVWNFLPAQTIDEPVVLERNTAGQLEAVEGNDQNKGIEIKANAGTLAATNKTNSFGSSGFSSPGYFAGKSLAVINFSDHLLMSRVGESVLKELKKEQQFDRLEYYPAGHLPEPGLTTPDLILTLDLAALEESGIVDKSINAKVTATWGTELTRSHHTVWNELSPPTVKCNYNISVDHQSTYIGVQSSAARYEQQGENIANAISKKVIEDLNNLQKKHTPQPELPKGFFPEYHPTPEFDFLITYQAKRLTSFHGLCFHNETIWLIENVDHVEETLKTIRQELQDKGWKGELEEPGLTQFVHQRMENSGDILEVFSRRDGSSDIFTSTQNTPTDLYVRYREPMKRAAHRAVYEELLTDPDPDYQLLIDMKRSGTHEQREKMIEMVKTNTPVSSSAWLMLAEHYQRTDEKSALINALRVVHHLTYTMTDYSKVKNDIERIAKKAELALDEITKVEPNIFQQIGIPSLTAESNPQAVEIREGETAAFFVKNEEESWGVVSVMLQQKLKEHGDDIFDAQVLESNSNSSRSWSNFTFNTKTPFPYRTSKHVVGIMVNLELTQSESGNMQVTASIKD